MQLAGIRIAVGKIEPSKEPFFRSIAMARVNMQIALTHLVIMLLLVLILLVIGFCPAGAGDLSRR